MPRTPAFLRRLRWAFRGLRHQAAIALMLQHIKVYPPLCAAQGKDCSRLAEAEARITKLP
jgi:hypothetical protein